MGPQHALFDGTEWLLIFAVAGFVLSFALAKLRVLTDANVSTFASWTSAIAAGALAVFADGAGGPAGLFGRIAIFGLVWFCGGLLFTFGAMMGLEKANKNGDKS